MELVIRELNGALNPEEMRQKIVELERQIKAHPKRDERKDYPLRHHFAPGVYAREVTIPAGKIVVGEIHKTEHLNIVSKGSITVWTDEGMKRIDAPATLVSKPGMKRVGYAHADTVWTTIHPTNETDVDVIESMIIAKDFSEIDFGEKPQLKEGA